MERIIKAVRRLENEARIDYIQFSGPAEEWPYRRGIYVGKLDVLNSVLDEIEKMNREDV